MGKGIGEGKVREGKGKEGERRGEGKGFHHDPCAPINI